MELSTENGHETQQIYRNGINKMADGEDLNNTCFYNRIKALHGEDTVFVLKSVANDIRKLAHRNNDKLFLLNCRRLNKMPPHITQNVKCTYRLFRQNSPLTKEIDKITNRFKKDILNLEIKDTIMDIKLISNRLNNNKSRLESIIDPGDFVSFMSSQNIYYQRTFSNIKRKQREKFESLDNNDYYSRKGNSEWFTNLTDIHIPEDIADLLSLGPKFAIPYSHINLPLDQLITDIDYIISENVEKNLQDSTRAKCTNIVTNYMHKSRFKQDRVTENWNKLVFKTKNFFKANSNLLVLKTDKTNRTIIMDIEEYDRKLELLLSDAQTYQAVDKDPTPTIARMNNELINILFKNNRIDLHTKNKLICHNGVSPRIYGLVKDHKEGNPLRPVVSFINSPTYQTAKFVCNLLSNLSSNQYNIKDSFQFYHNIKTHTIPSEHIIISLDVKSLFTNIPIKLATDIIADKWEKLQSITQTKLTKVEFFQLLSLCCDEGYLVHKAKYYRMVDGVAMGSPLAPIVADLVMEHLLDNVVKLLPFQPSFYINM